MIPNDPMPDDILRIAFDLRNTGNTDGDEVPQMYIRDTVASATTPVQLLKGFERVHIQAGKTMRVQFELDIRKELAVLDFEWKWTVEPGEFQIGK